MNMQRISYDKLKEESILIEVSGGLINDITFPSDDNVNKIVRVLDYDTDGTPEEEMIFITDKNTSRGEARESIWENPNYKKEQSNYSAEGTEIKSIETDQTGGNVYNDVIELKDNSIVVITSDAVYYFRNRKDYALNQEDLGMILRF